MQRNISKWRVFWEIIIIRFKKPQNHPEFVMYFLVINLIFCALGVYVSIAADWLDNNKGFDFRALNTNVTTFYIAILAGACFDLFLTKAKILKTTISIFSISVLILGIAALIISYLIRLRYALPLTALFVLVSFFMWWIANAENDKLMNDDVPPNVTTGGDLTKAILGDLTGFKS
jgi:hypothetical protein